MTKAHIELAKRVVDLAKYDFRWSKWIRLLSKAFPDSSPLVWCFLVFDFLIGSFFRPIRSSFGGVSASCCASSSSIYNVFFYSLLLFLCVFMYVCLSVDQFLVISLWEDNRKAKTDRLFITDCKDIFFFFKIIVRFVFSLRWKQYHRLVIVIFKRLFVHFARTLFYVRKQQSWPANQHYYLKWVLRTRRRLIQKQTVYPSMAVITRAIR